MIGYKWGKGRLIVYGWPTYSAFVCCDLFFAQSSLQLSNTSRQDEKSNLDYYDYDECASLCSKCRRSNNLLVYPKYTNQFSIVKVQIGLKGALKPPAVQVQWFRMPLGSSQRAASRLFTFRDCLRHHGNHATRLLETRQLFSPNPDRCLNKLRKF